MRLFVDFNKTNIYERKTLKVADRDRIWTMIESRGDLRLHEIMIQI